MTDIKVGDLDIKSHFDSAESETRQYAVFRKGDRKELRKIASIEGWRGEETISFDRIPLIHARYATPAEIAAGHRIDIVKDCPHPILDRGLCVDGKQPCLRCGAYVESGKEYGGDEGKESVTGSRSEFEQWFVSETIEGQRLLWLYHEHFKQSKEDALKTIFRKSTDGIYVIESVYYASLAWQHQQAVVDELKKLPSIIHTIIVKDGDTHWFAQALNIDYAACGLSLADIQRNFEIGLRGTIEANLKRFKNISRIVAPNGGDIEHVLNMTDSQQRRIEELQKRVDAALEKLDQFWCEGNLDSLKEAEKALGADHETT